MAAACWLSAAGQPGSPPLSRPASLAHRSPCSKQARSAAPASTAARHRYEHWPARPAWRGTGLPGPRSVSVQTVAACMAAGMTIEQVAELQLAFPTFTEAVSMAAQKICRSLGIGQFPQVWSYLGAED